MRVRSLYNLLQIEKLIINLGEILSKNLLDRLVKPM